MPKALIAGGLCVGLIGISCAAIFVRLSQPAPPVVVAFYRMFLASVLMLFALAFSPALRAQLPGGWRALLLSPQARAAAIAGLLFAIDHAFWHTAIRATSVANATLLLNTTPIYIGAYTVWVLGERLHPSLIIGAALGLAGCAVLLGVEVDRGARFGDLLALVAALFYSGYLLCMKRARIELSTFATVLIASTSASLVLGVYCLVSGDPFHGFPVGAWLAIWGNATVTQLAGIFGVIWALGYMPTSFASVALLGQPVGTALLGWLILGEALSVNQLFGGVAILIGIFAASRVSDGQLVNGPGASSKPSESGAPGDRFSHEQEQ